MSIKQKLIGALSCVFMLIIAINVVTTLERNGTLIRINSETDEELAIIAEEDVEEALLGSTDKIAKHIISIAEEMKINMINTGNSVSNRNATEELDVFTLREIAGISGVDDIQMTDKTGKVIMSTTESQIGTVITGNWEAYQLVLDGKVNILPSDIRYDENEGIPVLYTAIPTAQKDGLLNVTKDITETKTIINEFVSDTKGYKSMYLISRETEVLMSFVKESEKVLYAEGEQLLDNNIQEVLKTGKEKIVVTEENAIVFYPVSFLGNTRYVIRMEVLLEPYFVYSEISRQAMEDIRHSSLEGSRTSMFIVIAIIILCGGLMWVLITRILNRLGKMIDVTDSIAEGKLDVQLEVKSNDEIGKLGKSFNKMIADLRNMTLNIKESTGVLLDKSDEIKNAVESVSYGNNEITRSIDDMAQGAVSQAEESTETLNSTHELANNVNVLIGNINEVSSNMSEVEEISKSGIESLDVLEEKFSNNIVVTENLANNLSELEQKSESIGKIIDIINGITDQTNLLSLNASIEAARAGEQGKGFAVVANEVKTLADQSANATKEIKKIISEINEMINSLTFAMGEVKATSDNSRETLETTKEVFVEITTSVGGVMDNTRKMTDEIEKVTVVKNRVLESIENISSVSEESAAGAEEVNASVMEQHEHIGHVAESMQKINILVNELTDLVDVYQL